MPGHANSKGFADSKGGTIYTTWHIIFKFFLFLINLEKNP